MRRRRSGPSFIVTAWKTSEEAIGRGTLPALSMTVDTLHTLHVSTMSVWARVAIWALLHNDAHGAAGTAEEKLLSACLALRRRLSVGYKQRREPCREKSIARLSDRTVRMLGVKQRPEARYESRGDVWGDAVPRERTPTPSGTGKAQ